MLRWHSASWKLAKREALPPAGLRATVSRVSTPTQRLPARLPQDTCSVGEPGAADWRWAQVSSHG